MVEEQWKFLQDIALLIQYANRIGVVLTAGEAYRTHDQQLLYYYGKTLRLENGEIELYDAPKRSWTMRSRHLNRLAMDFNFFIDGKLVYDEKNPKLIQLGEFWENLDEMNEWGGFWSKPDTPHFQRNLDAVHKV